MGQEQKEMQEYDKCDDSATHRRMKDAANVDYYFNESNYKAEKKIKVIKNYVDGLKFLLNDSELKKRCSHRPEYKKMEQVYNQILTDPKIKKLWGAIWGKLGLRN